MTELLVVEIILAILSFLVVISIACYFIIIRKDRNNMKMNIADIDKNLKALQAQVAKLSQDSAALDANLSELSGGSLTLKTNTAKKMIELKEEIETQLINIKRDLSAHETEHVEQRRLLNDLKDRQPQRTENMNRRSETTAAAETQRDEFMESLIKDYTNVNDDGGSGARKDFLIKYSPSEFGLSAETVSQMLFVEKAADDFSFFEETKDGSFLCISNGSKMYVVPQFATLCYINAVQRQNVGLFRLFNVPSKDAQDYRLVTPAVFTMAGGKISYENVVKGVLK